MSKNTIVSSNKDLGSNGIKGGIFKGDRHSAPSGGIAVSVEGGGNVLVEDSEPIIVPEAVNSNTLVSFDGKKMKPKEVISKINTSYGGVPIKKKGGIVDAKAEIKRLRDIKEKKERGGNIEQRIKVQAGSVVVTRNAALDEKTKHEYNGEMLTNKEILSRINHDIGGGVEFAQGGKIGQEVFCHNCGWQWNTNQSENYDKYVCHNCGLDNSIFYTNDSMSKGGEISDHEETYKKWKSLVNMNKSELENFYNSEEGKEAGLSSSKANKLGIHSGRESARWIMKMKDTPHQDWTPKMWEWAKRQISFISRMSGNKGGLYDDKGNKTRKHTSLLIWGHNPKKYEVGGILKVGDLSNVGIIEDEYGQQYKANGNWYHKSIVKPIEVSGIEKDINAKYYNDLIVPNSIDPKKVISAFANPIDTNKVEQYAAILREEMLSNNFPPITGYPYQIEKEDIGEYFLSGKEISKKDVGDIVWKVWDGHHRVLAAIEANLPYIEVELEYAAITKKESGGEIYLPKYGDDSYNIELAKKLVSDLGLELQFIGYSDTNGTSVYFEDKNGLKYRVSDHSVTSKSRMDNEILLSFDERLMGFRGSEPEIKSKYQRNLDVINSFKSGGTISQTPAPKSDKVYGSKVNDKGSSKDTKTAKGIKFDAKTLLSINEKVKEHNKQHPNKKITLASAKAVVRRGMGAYSSTHRPTISGGKPNSRVAWGLARLNAFMYKIIHGKSKSGKYKQDDDLINELGYSVKSYEDGGTIESVFGNKILEISKQTGIKFTKSKNTNSWYGGNGYYDRIRLSDHISKFDEKSNSNNLGTSIDLNLTYYSTDAIIHLLNNTDPFANYKKGDKITHSYSQIGDVIYLSSDYEKGYVEVETKDNRVVKYDMNKFLGKENNFEQGGIFNDKELLTKWKKGESIGFTAIAHLKAKGLIPRADGTKRKSEKYMDNGGLIEQLRAEEQSEYHNMSNPKDENKRKEIYDKYDKLITPLMKQLAPNGKPSNLTPEQYKLVRTPQFKAFFGDWENDPSNASKVVDSNGEPLVVYHGSPKFGFNEFLEKQGAKSKSNMQLLFGNHFATSKDDARIYAKEKGGVYDLFLNIKTPINLSKGFVEKGNILFDAYLKLSKELNLSKDFKNNLDYQIFTKEGNDGGKSKDVQRVFITQYMLDKYAPSKVFTALKNNGFDGVFYEPYQPQGFNTISKFSQSYITFSPNQIKLADGTNTTFDMNNEDIRYESGGEILKDHNFEFKKLKMEIDEKQKLESGGFVNDGEVLEFNITENEEEKDKEIFEQQFGKNNLI